MSSEKPKSDLLIQSIIKKYSLCDYCISRLFEVNSNIYDYKKIGKKIRLQNKYNHKIKADDCFLCNGISKELDDFQLLIEEELEPYEYQTFVLGFHIDEDILKKEEEIISEINDFKGEYLKNYFQRIIGLNLENKLEKEVEFDNPDIMVICNTKFNTVSLQIKQLFIYGRYKKLKRGIPQTRWFCRSCRGKGCRKCQYTGTLYSTSIEKLISYPILKKCHGTDSSFHGAGREDIDVKMLGNGRPFVVEINNPVKRSISLEKITEEINKKNIDHIEVSNLHFCKKKEIKRLKAAAFNKVYLVEIEAKNGFKRENLLKVALALRGKIIEQYTPTRVAKRRANKIRRRQIYDCNLERIDETRARFKIESESGTYIKELITGDDGKTKPSFSELIGQPCTVITLDVIEIKGE